MRWSLFSGGTEVGPRGSGGGNGRSSPQVGPWWKRAPFTREELTILSTAVETSGVLVAVLDPDGRLLRFNAECERLTGYQAHEVLGRTFSDFLRAKAGSGSLEAAFSGPDPARFPNRVECVLVGRGGVEAVVAWRNAAVTRADGSLRWVVSTGVEMTERDRAARRLQLFKDGLDHTSEIVFLTDADGRIIYVNPAFEEAYRIPGELAVGETPSILNAGLQSSDVYRELWERLVLGEAYRGVLVNRSGDGRVIRAETSANPVFGRDGSIVAFVAIQRQLPGGDALGGPAGGGEADSVRTVMEAVPGGLALVTPEGVVRYANPALLAFLDRPADQVLGRPVETCLPMADQDSFRRDFVRAGLGSPDFSGDYSLARPVGEPLPVTVTARALDCCGEPMVLLTFQDLSDRKRLEDRIRHAQKMQAVGHLAGGIAHDFNNLLTVVQANTELLLTAANSGGEKGRGDIEELLEVLKASRRGKGLVQKILAFSRKERLTFASVDLAKLLLELRTPLTRLLPASITIELDVPRGLPPIWADEGSVEQVLLNLATNARDAMPDGGTLSLSVTRSRFPDSATHTRSRGSAGEFLCVNVTDEGVGMDAETRDRAFEPFFTTKKVGDGTGLGMAAVYGLVKAHGGMVNLYSEVGEGTTVKVYLPVVAEASERREPVPQTQDGSADDTELPTGHETILVVEDEPALRKAARKTLELVGYRVLVARDGVEGLRVFRENRDGIDLVVSDLIMPRMGGRGLYHAIQDEKASVRFLFVSGYDTEAAAGERDLREVLPFIEKPWTIQEFTRKVREVLDNADPD